MLKKLVIGLLNRIFGLKLTEADLDAFVAFINMLIGVFGSTTEAVSFMKRTTVKAKNAGPLMARASFEGMERTMGGV